MIEILSDWLETLPEQFKNKPNTEVLIKAFSRQLQEAVQMFEDLKTKRSLNDAVGAQLDGIGDIVNLNRMNPSIYTSESARSDDDERYRMFLKFKAIRNSNNCTYNDIVKAIQLLWNPDIIFYAEHPEDPAAIYISMVGTFSQLQLDMMTRNDLMIKSAGVRMNMSHMGEGFFGFRDINPLALGFGKGKFAHWIQ